MRRLALVTVLTLLALPGAALAGPTSGASFYARVVRASVDRVTLRLSSGAVVSYAAVAAPAAGVAATGPTPLAHVARATPPAATINLRALQPGVTVLATVAADVPAAAAITVPGPDAPAVTGERHAAGTVADVQQDAFLLQLADRSQLRLHASPGVIGRLRACERVAVSYHQDAGMLIDDAVHGAAGGRDAHCPGGVHRDATGTITRVSSRALTIATGAGRRLTFALASRDVTQGFRVGDLVDVAFRAGAGGRVGYQVEYVEAKATGTVTAASPRRLTLIDSAGGRRATFVTGSAQDLPAGEHVVVVYHRSGGRPVADVLYAAQAW